MAKILNMPKLGMDMEEGTLLRWLKKTGETVKKGEPVAEIETDKSTMELESPADGQILHLYCQEGDSVAINAPVAAIGEPGEVPPAAEPAKAEAAPNDAAPSESAPQQTAEGLLVMPKLGMDMAEGTLLRWIKAVGERVSKGTVVAEIETDKSAMELESSVEGILLKTFCGEGNCVPVGQPIAFIGEESASIPVFPEASASPAKKEIAPAVTVPAPAAVDVKPTPAPVQPGGKKIRVSPRAKKLAEKNNIDLSMVVPSGPGGRIVEKDVRAAMQAGACSKPAKVRKARGETVKPLTGIRKVISSRMHQSLSEMAQANHRMDADMTNMTALRKQLNSSPVFAENKVSYLDLITLACARALTDRPEANVSLLPDGIHFKEFVNIGIAVDTERGLVVPVIHDVDQMTLQELCSEGKRVITKAKGGALAPDDMRGGTFTISNLGMFGVDSFTAIVNPPEACILALGRIADRAVVVDGALAVRSTMTLSLTYDHRILDGAPAARLLQRIQYYIENPALLLL